ncbi:MAG: LysR family transcriptional regulator [Pseudoxanthomonas sp.]
MPLQRIDLNLFRVFEAVLEHGSIVGAARALSVTPSAVSHAIARLREALGDPLFIATDQGMKPTPRALELAPHVQGGLERIDMALKSRKFSPDTAVRTFRIAMSEYSGGIVLPHLVGRLQQAASGIDLRIFPFDNVDTIKQIDDGRLDAVVGWFTDLPSRLRRRLLWRDVESIIARHGHPLTQRSITREALLEYPHAVVELSGSGDSYDDGFARERGAVMRVWLERLLLDTRDEGAQVVGRAAISLPHYANVVSIVACTDLLATLPASYAAPAVADGRVVYLPLPYEPVVGHLEAVWHERSDSDEALQWLLRQVGEAAAQTRASTNAPGID